jgi:hypothetical protein
LGSSTPQGLRRARAGARLSVAFRLPCHRRRPDSAFSELTTSGYPAYICPCPSFLAPLFGGSACRYIPTLPGRSCDRPGMARGQDGSLLLSCVTLSFTTPRRFIPTLSTTEVVPTIMAGTEGFSPCCLSVQNRREPRRFPAVVIQASACEAPQINNFAAGLRRASIWAWLISP